MITGQITMTGTAVQIPFPTIAQLQAVGAPVGGTPPGNPINTPQNIIPGIAYLIVTGPSAADVYVGNSTGVTTSTGMRIPSGAGPVSIPWKGLPGAWAVGASGNLSYAWLFN